MMEALRFMVDKIGGPSVTAMITGAGLPRPQNIGRQARLPGAPCRRQTCLPARTAPHCSRNTSSGVLAVSTASVQRASCS